MNRLKMKINTEELDLTTEEKWSNYEVALFLYREAFEGEDIGAAIRTVNELVIPFLQDET